MFHTFQRPCYNARLRGREYVPGHISGEEYFQGREMFGGGIYLGKGMCPGNEICFWAYFRGKVMSGERNMSGEGNMSEG